MPQHIDVPGMGRVEFPDGMDDAQITAAIQSSMGSAPPPPVDPGLDTIKGTGVGIAKGTLGLLDIPQLAIRGGRAANDYLWDKFGNSPGDFADRWGGLGESSLPNLPMPSQTAQKQIEDNITGKFYKPQTKLGEWGETIGEFATAIPGGGGSIPARVLTRAVLPALASEGAGYMTKGTKAELPARLAAAALAGPAAERAVAGRMAPTADQLRQAYRDVRNDPAVTGIPIAQDRLADNIRNSLDTRNFDPLNAPLPYRRADYVENMQGPRTVNDAMAVRQRLSADERSARGNQITGAPEEASRAAKRGVDDYISTVEPRWRDANRNYAVAGASDYLNGRVVEGALDRAGAANSGQNIGNSMRSRRASILASPKASGRFTEPQLDRVREIDRGTTTSNTLRAWANRLGGGGGLGQTMLTATGLGGAGYYGGGEAGAATGVALALGGKGLKAAENAVVRRQINNLDRDIRLSSPLGAQAGRLSADDLNRVAQALVRRESAAASNY